MTGLPATSATCPHCGERLRAWTLGDVTLDGCDACGGCWFDGGELESSASLDGAPLEAAELAFAPGLSAFAGGGPGRCPRCATRLVERTLAGSGVAVQTCVACGGLWFDEGGLEAVAAHLPADRRRRPAEVAAALVGPLTRPVACPHCGELNPASQMTCAACQRWMDDSLEGQPGPQIGSHPFDWATLGSELLYAVGVLLAVLVLWEPEGRHAWSYRYRSLGVTPDLGLLLRLGGAVLFVWYARWLFKTWSIDLNVGGLMVRRLTGRTFIPWTQMHRVVTVDLPGRVHANVFTPSRRRATSQSGPDGAPVLSAPLRGAVLVFTAQGLVTIGPHLKDSGGLYREVRERWD